MAHEYESGGYLMTREEVEPPKGASGPHWLHRLTTSANAVVKEETTATEFYFAVIVESQTPSGAPEWYGWAEDEATTEDVIEAALFEDPQRAVLFVTGTKT